MQDRLDPPERAKLYSAYHAMRFVEDDMRVGLGTGSTASWLVKLLGARRHIEGLDIRCVATSSQTHELAERVGLPVGTLDDAGWLDLTIDGADEFDPQLSLIKGGGGALLREKIVATASERMIVISDESKEVATLGAFPLPVEVVKFGWEATGQLIEDALEGADVDGTRIERRMRGGAPFVTDEGHYIYDLHLGRIGDVDQLAADLLRIAGVVETGLFIDIADTVVLGAASGEARLIYAEQDEETIDIEDAGRMQAHFDAIAD